MNLLMINGLQGNLNIISCCITRPWKPLVLELTINIIVFGFIQFPVLYSFQKQRRVILHILPTYVSPNDTLMK